jgi:hypothetical protein
MDMTVTSYTRLLGLTLIFSVGCAAKTATLSPLDENAHKAVVEKKLPEEGLILVEVDLDIDGQPDIFNYYRERADAPRIIVKKEVDLNHDGRVDVISYFDIRGELEREEMDGDFDGTFDTTDYYKNGNRVMSERDTSFDGRPNVFSYYEVSDGERGKITHQERDENGDGQIDYWLRFDAAGNVIKTGRDIDGDGKMDVREE